MTKGAAETEIDLLDHETIDLLERDESGPLCRHWHDPEHCDRGCTCSHLCGMHDANGICAICVLTGDGGCSKGWTDPIP
jgi:hypothetical protein